MDDFVNSLTAILGAQLSTVFVLAGILFLFLAVVGKVGATIVVSAQRQKYAALIGVLLIVLGLALMVVETEHENGEDEEPAPTTSQPAPIYEPGKPSVEPRPPERDIIAQGREAWLTGNYDSAFRHFQEIVQAVPDTDAGRLAKARIGWLRPYLGRILFADDFEDSSSVISGARWRIEPGEPPIGGRFIVTPGDIGHVFQGENHYHATPRLQIAQALDTFEIKLRIRPKIARNGGVHINIMMHPAEGRTTVGLYFQENNLSIWESKNGQEIGRKDEKIDGFTDWRDVHILVSNQAVEVRMDDGPAIRYESPRARPISLTDFNLEVLISTVQFDDVLIVSR